MNFVSLVCCQQICLWRRKNGDVYVYIQLNFTTIKAMQEGITHNSVVKSAKEIRRNVIDGGGLSKIESFTIVHEHEYML